MFYLQKEYFYNNIINKVMSIAEKAITVRLIINILSLVARYSSLNSLSFLANSFIGVQYPQIYHSAFSIKIPL